MIPGLGTFTTSDPIVVIWNPCPSDIAIGVMQTLPEGWVADALIASKLGAALAFCHTKTSDAFRKHIGYRPEVKP